jgi:hypothetical protein
MDYFIKYGMILLVVLLLLFIPEHVIFHEGTSLCIFNILTGIQCPLCGMTRASCDLLHFRAMSAIHYNPVSVFLPIILVIEIVYDVFHRDNLKKLRRIMFLIFFISLGILFALRIVDYFAIS